MNKKILIVFFLTLILPLISAQSLFQNLDLGEGMRQLIDQAIGFGTPVFEIIIGDYSGSEFFFAKVMLLFLLVVVIYIILDRLPIFEGLRNISMIISIIISVLAVRFISENQLILGILLPYGTLGVALTAALPFLIWTYGVHSLGISGLGRRIAWIFFGIVFITLWIYKSTDIGPLGNQIYFWTSIAIAAMIFFDRRIHAYFSGADMRRYERTLSDKQISDLQAELSRLLRESEPSPSPEQRRTIERIRRRLRHLGATSSSI